MYWRVRPVVEAVLVVHHIHLSDGQVEKQRDLIRISSYRWKEVKGVGPNSALEPKITSNYLWFLEHIRERGQILCVQHWN